MSRLPRAFFARNVDVVARDLIGRHLVRPGDGGDAGDVVLRIVETEAYAGDDSACHAFRGPTPRTAPLFGPPGHAYIYLCYGIHTMLNLVAGEDGTAAGVLIRAAEVVAGHDVVTKRRGRAVDDTVCSGPGKIGAALNLSSASSGSDICVGDFLSVHEGTPPRVVAVGPRVGIDFATPDDVARPWRFADADSRAVSLRRLLLPPVAKSSSSSSSSPSSSPSSSRSSKAKRAIAPATTARR